MLKGLRRRLAVIFTAFTGVVLAAVLGVSYYLTARQTVEDNKVWFSNTVDTVATTTLTYAATGETVNLYTGSYVVELRQDGERMTGITSVSGEPAAQTAPAATLTQAESDRLFEAAKEEAGDRGLSQWVFEAYQLSVDGGLAIQVMEKAGDASGADASEAADSGATAAASDDGMSGYGVVEGGTVAITMSSSVGTEGLFDLVQDGVRYRATYFSLPAVLAGQDEHGVYEIAVLEDLSGQNRSLLLSGLLYLLILLVGLALLYAINWFLARLVLRPTEEGMRRQTEFVAAASHELRSPLAVIRSSLSAAQAAPDEQQAEKYQGAAAQEAERMTHLVDDLLLLAGGDAGNWTLHPEPVDLDTLLIDAAEVYRPLARQKDVGLALELPGETLPQVKGDAERLRQILAVLLDNALQYAPAGTDVVLSARQKRGKVRIDVADRGRGVPDEEKERVFQRFYRADGSRHDKEHFGLGLSVAQELAQLHGGSLTVTDTRDGGATFTLTLPVK